MPACSWQVIRRVDFGLVHEDTTYLKHSELAALEGGVGYIPDIKVTEN